MKKLLLICLTIALHAYVHAQHCTSYFFDNKKIIQLDNYNKRGDKDGYLIYKITGITTKGSTTTAQVNTQLFDKNKKLLNTGNHIVKCFGDMVLMDMKLFIPQQQTEQYGSPETILKNSFLEFPADMKEGDHLKDGHFEMEVDKNGLKQILQMDITDRVITGKETITTTAGRWECFIIKQSIKLNLQTGPIAIPLTIETTEWYAPSLGIAKTITGEQATQLASIK
ncbi:MAG: hypothetical protein QM802_01205 [Agriterribacter sp.]